MIKKRYGQNFISDKNLINKIINLIDIDSDLVIEIGPGRGALTNELKNRFKKVIAFEIDSDLKEYLDKIDGNNLSIIYKDIFDVNIIDIIKNYKNVSIVSNTPYYLTSKIIFLIFELSESQKITNSVLMVQKEVAKRICAKKGEKNYNNISIASEIYSNVKYEFTVNKNMFYPIPKIDSSIISFDFNNHKYTNINKKDFVEMVRKLFNNKRKTILNNLKNITDKYNLIIDKISINPKSRPEELSLDDFIKIYTEVLNVENKSKSKNKFNA